MGTEAVIEKGNKLLSEGSSCPSQTCLSARSRLLSLPSVLCGSWLASELVIENQTWKYSLPSPNRDGCTMRTSGYQNQNEKRTRRVWGVGGGWDGMGLYSQEPLGKPGSHVPCLCYRSQTLVLDDPPPPISGVKAFLAHLSVQLTGCCTSEKGQPKYHSPTEEQLRVAKCCNLPDSWTQVVHLTSRDKGFVHIVTLHSPICSLRGKAVRTTLSCLPLLPAQPSPMVQWVTSRALGLRNTWWGHNGQNYKAEGK